MLDKYAEKVGFKLTKEIGFDMTKKVPLIDLYFMNLCFGINLRSIDKSSKCGCVFVAGDGAILSSGYNNPIRGADDNNIPQTRPEKYFFYEHSERNAIYNAARHGIKLMGSTVFVTGFICFDCLRGMIQVGVERIVYGPLQVKMGEIRENELYKHLLNEQSIVIERFKYDEGLYFLNPVAKYMVDIKKEQGIDDVSFHWDISQKKRIVSR